LKKRLLHLIFSLIGLGILCFFLALGILTWAEKHPGPITHQTDAIIVLGAQVYADGSLSPQLELRMEAALASWQANPRPVICCGAKGANEPEAEGTAMQKWLMQRGVPAHQALAETQSYDTIQNLKNAKRMMEERGYTRAMLVTSDYHLTRALWIARNVGLDVCGVAAKSPSDVFSYIKVRIQECFSWLLFCKRMLNGRGKL